MSHLFHEERHALHGVTVVLDTTGGETHLGRFDLEDGSGVHLINVASHQGDPASRDEFIRRSARFGIQVERKHLVVPSESVARVMPLGEV